MNKILLAILFGSFFAVSSAHAVSLDEVISKIKVYQMQNTSDPAVLGASAYGSVVNAPEQSKALKPEQSQIVINELRLVSGEPISTIVSKTIRCGIRGDEDVKKLQAFLSAKGYLDTQYITGNYHAITKQALQKFQMRMGITGPGADGCIVGPLTKRALSVSY